MNGYEGGLHDWLLEIQLLGDRLESRSCGVCYLSRSVPANVSTKLLQRPPKQAEPGTLHHATQRVAGQKRRMLQCIGANK